MTSSKEASPDIAPAKYYNRFLYLTRLSFLMSFTSAMLSIKHVLTGVYGCCVVADFCIKHRCLNNATCVNQQVNYTCSCEKGWTGKYCEQGKSVLVSRANV